MREVMSPEPRNTAHNRGMSETVGTFPISEPWNDPRPFRNMDREREEGVAAFRGLFFGMLLSAGILALITGAVMAIGSVFA